MLNYKFEIKLILYITYILNIFSSIFGGYNKYKSRYFTITSSNKANIQIYQYDYEILEYTKYFMIIKDKIDENFYYKSIDKELRFKIIEDLSYIIPLSTHLILYFKKEDKYKILNKNSNNIKIYSGIFDFEIDNIIESENHKYFIINNRMVYKIEKWNEVYKVYTNITILNNNYFVYNHNNKFNNYKLLDEDFNKIKINYDQSIFKHFKDYKNNYLLTMMEDKESNYTYTIYRLKNDNSLFKIFVFDSKITGNYNLFQYNNNIIFLNYKLENDYKYKIENDIYDTNILSSKMLTNRSYELTYKENNYNITLIYNLDSENSPTKTNNHQVIKYTHYLSNLSSEIKELLIFENNSIVKYDNNQNKILIYLLEEDEILLDTKILNIYIGFYISKKNKISFKLFKPNNQNYKLYFNCNIDKYYANDNDVENVFDLFIFKNFLYYKNELFFKNLNQNLNDNNNLIISSKYLDIKNYLEEIILSNKKNNIKLEDLNNQIDNNIKNINNLKYDLNVAYNTIKELKNKHYDNSKLENIFIIISIFFIVLFLISFIILLYINKKYKNLKKNKKNLEESFN